MVHVSCDELFWRFWREHSASSIRNSAGLCTSVGGIHIHEIDTKWHGIQYMPGVKPVVIATLCTVTQLCLLLLCPICTKTALPHAVQPLPSGFWVTRGRFLLVQDMLVHNPSRHEGPSLGRQLGRVCHRGLSVGPFTRFWLCPGLFG